MIEIYPITISGKWCEIDFLIYYSITFSGFVISPNIGMLCDLR